MAQSAEKRWYVRGDIDDWRARDLWLFENQTATRVFVANPERGAGTFFQADPDEDFWACIRRQTSWLEPGAPGFHSMTLGPGEYYPRIARPLVLASLELRGELWSPASVLAEKAHVANTRSQLTSLTRRLGTICQTVQPTEKKTLDVAYGHEIRNLLILAATEAEMHWRGILTANGRSAAPNSNEYLKLVDPLRLLDYEITFHDFPDLQPVKPFAGWSKLDPTESLRWYAAYHGVKHNRENEFERGTLRRFEAVSACVALVVAQFGRVALSTELLSFVDVSVPTWPIGEMYLSPVTPGVGWTPVRAFNSTEQGIR
jgi:hypothetical protein